MLAGELGFEPRQTESESVVLPLHHSPKIAQRHQQVRRSFGQLPAAGLASPARLAPFYSLLPALVNPLASAWRWAWCRGPRKIRGPLAALSAPRSGRLAYEPFFRRAGLPPDADGRAHLEAAKAAELRYRYL